MALDACIDIVQQAAGRELNERERAAIQKRAIDVLTKLKNGEGNIEDLISGMKDNIQAAAAIRARNTAFNYRALGELEQFRKLPANARNPVDALKGLVAGSMSDRAAGKESAASLVSSEQDMRVSRYVTQVEKQGLLPMMASGANDKNIFMAKYWLQHGEAEKAAEYGKDAVDAAQTMMNHDEPMRQDYNKYGGFAGKNPDRVTRNSHDPYKVGKAGGNQLGSDAAREAWISDISKDIDWNKAFGGDFATAGDAQRMKLLRSQFEQLSTGQHLKFNDVGTMPAVGMANLGKKHAYEREYVWKTPEAEFEYQNKYGNGGSLNERYMSDLRQTARDTALMRKFGPNAQANIDHAVESWKKTLIDQGRGQDAKNLEIEHDRLMKKVWPVITGESSIPAGHQGLAQYSAAARAWQPLAKLGSVVIRQIGDLATRAQILNHYGSRSIGGFLQETARGVSDMMKITGDYDKANLKDYGAEMSILLDNPHLPMSSSNLLTEIGAGKIADLDRKMMRYTGSTAWLNRMRTTSAAATGVRHWAMRDKAYADLPEGLQSAFKQYGITDKGWDILRSQEGFDLGNGHTALSVDGLKDLEPSAFKSIATMAEPTDTHMARQGEILAANYRNLVSEIANLAVNHPSYNIRALALQGTRPGEALGEMVRHAAVFKMWTLSYMRNFIGRELHGYSEDKVGNAEAMMRLLKMKDGGRGMTGLATLVAGGLFWGNVVNMIGDVTKGKVPQNPFDPEQAGDALKRAMVTGSTAGLYSDFLLSNAHDFWGTVGDQLGPVAGTIGRVSNAAGGMMRGIKEDYESGDDTKFLAASDRMLTAIEDQVPGRNFIYTKAAMDYFVLDNISEALNPGWKQRKEDALMKNHGQVSFLGGGG